MQWGIVDTNSCLGTKPAAVGCDESRQSRTTTFTTHATVAILACTSLGGIACAALKMATIWSTATGSSAEDGLGFVYTTRSIIQIVVDLQRFFLKKKTGCPLGDLNTMPLNLLRYVSFDPIGILVRIMDHGAQGYGADSTVAQEITEDCALALFAIVSRCVVQDEPTWLPPRQREGQVTNCFGTVGAASVWQRD